MPPSSENFHCFLCLPQSPANIHMSAFFTVFPALLRCHHITLLLTTSCKINLTPHLSTPDAVYLGDFTFSLVQARHASLCLLTWHPIRGSTPFTLKIVPIWTISYLSPNPILIHFSSQHLSIMCHSVHWHISLFSSSPSRESKFHVTVCFLLAIL